ncbi:MAG: hypothetical protein JWP45_633 [Mucilaginibacter sp.]|nr:hypothetical protein [Mucilaginibacter sp.]
MEPDHTPEQGIIGMLEDAQDVGMTYVVFGPEVEQLYFFDRAGDALEFAATTNRQGQLPWSDVSLPLQYMTIEQMLSELEKANPLTINKIDMNRNNLENLKDEMRALGINEKLITQMEKNMENNVPQFALHDSITGNKGVVNVAIPFKQSGQSEHFYLNKYQVSLDKGGKALEEGQKYMVIARGEENKYRSFQDPHEAIAYFKDKKGNGELAIGKDIKNKTMLATMENDKVNYVVKDFQRTFNNPAVTQTFYVENGKGFTVEQAANLIQGRAVYRDDLANAAGMSYKAWVVLDLSNAKDRHGNFLSKHYHDPSYGFDLGKVLDSFNIKELNDPAKREKLDESIRQGNRPLVTVSKEGQDMQVHLEAAPRYSQLNMYQENGKPEKREQFLKPEFNQAQQIGKGKEQVKEQQQEQGMAV